MKIFSSSQSGAARTQAALMTQTPGPVEEEIFSPTGQIGAQLAK
jgi:hypothetical protein